MSAEKTAAPPPVDPRIQRLLTLLTLLKNARHKKKTTELAFLMVNQTFNLLQYRHCVFWRYDGEYAYLDTASGLVQIDPMSPYCLWMKKSLRYIIEQTNARMEAERQQLPPEKKNAEEGFARSFPMTEKDYTGPEADQWAKWVSAHALFVPMRNVGGTHTYGLWLDRDAPFTDTDRAFIEDLADGYAGCLHYLEQESATTAPSKIKEFFRPRRMLMKIILLISVFALFLPVRMSITAPAEVVAQMPKVVSIPFAGTLERVVVEPNQGVRKGDLLAVMDSTALKSKYELAERELATAQAALVKTEREALRDPEKRMEINILKAQIQAKETEKEFASDFLDKALITAPTDGIVIFSDPNALRGKPVGTGDQIMMVANPQDTELLIRVPVDAMIEIEDSQMAQFFLNVSPLGSEPARIKTISYQSSPDADGVMSYKIRAEFTDKAGAPRVGWTGTAKVYGHKTILLLNILRRPFITLRRMTGL